MIEAVVAAAVTALMFGVVGTVFTSLAQGTREVQRVQVAENQAVRTRVTLTNDLQLTDTLGVDATTGTPFFQILDVNGGQQNAIQFRTVIGFGPVGGGGMGPIYSEPILYQIDSAESLTRAQDGSITVVAHGVREVQFQLTETGVIVIDLRTISDSYEDEHDVVSHFQISPRNTLQM